MASQAARYERIYPTDDCIIKEYEEQLMALNERFRVHRYKLRDNGKELLILKDKMTVVQYKAELMPENYLMELEELNGAIMAIELENNNLHGTIDFIEWLKNQARCSILYLQNGEVPDGQHHPAADTTEIDTVTTETDTVTTQVGAVNVEGTKAEEEEIKG
ncbi:uncharacterized protein LAJ45_11572 [Morchella importuna]|uniref:uncharacterized protein n=1 Tax=Morchella importuna TaxID=1174673 RepID=UPI001E8CFF96|nr:uncharacterized protein LAJ45_11572 [Morchella importuna]KAH8144442.1 hypothetical protein LAJ45_11572 [Morchella importuna]